MNASEDSTAAVQRALLKAGSPSPLITEGQYEGSFLVSYADWQSVAGDYLLSGVGVTGPAALAIPKAPVVSISGQARRQRQGLRQDHPGQRLPTSTTTTGRPCAPWASPVTDDASQADLIIGAAALDEQALAAVKSGTPYIGYGSKAMKSAVSLFDEARWCGRPSAPTPWTPWPTSPTPPTA